jgi:hypothetical protein
VLNLTANFVRCNIVNDGDNDIVRDLIKNFPGNGSVYTFQRVTMETVSQWANVIARC